MPRHFILALTLILLATSALATTFVVPEDGELIAKADAIVIGTIDGSSVQKTELGIETVYDLRVSRTIKGLPRTLDLIRIVSPGGHLGSEGGVIVHGAAHFEKGDRVLLFLTRDRGRWTPADMTLGKFRFRTSTAGASVLVRDDEDIVGWDRGGRMHVERIRREAPFVRFVEERVAGRRPKADYFAATSEVVVEETAHEDAIQIQPNAPAFPAPTYTEHLQLSGSWTPTRWANMAAGATFYKRTSTNIPGAADGGVSVIQNSFASWNGECGSTINLIYGGTRETASANQDGISMIEFNDPQGRIAGSFGGSGTVGITFLSYWNPHQFPAGGQTWWSIRDADVVFQDGYTASNAGFPTAMMHEVGHGLGYRHSNAHYIRATGSDEPCNPSISECSNSAIMYFSVIAGFGYTLQTWDINASQAVYPGGSCGTPRRQKTPSDFNGDGVSDYVIFRAGTFIAFNFNTGAQVWSVATGITDGIPLPMDYDGDGRTELTVYKPGKAWHFYNDNGTYLKGIWIGVAGDIPVPADYDGDGREDVMVFRNGTWVRYDFNSGAPVSTVNTGSMPDAIPLPIDYDGDGTADLSVYRAGRAWHFYNDNGSYFRGVWLGIPGDIPVPGDYDGNGVEEAVVYRADNTWRFFDVNTGANIRNVSTGVASSNGDPLQPSPLDYDGDGSVDFTVFAGGPWYTFHDSGALRAAVWTGGNRGDLAMSRRDHWKTTP